MRNCSHCGQSFDDSTLRCPDDDTELTGVAGAAQPEEKPLAAGTELGSYRILDLLGEGGMEFVYLAGHLRLGRKVAPKHLRAEFAANPRASHRFFAEARAVNRIAHENIIQITDFVDDRL